MAEIIFPPELGAPLKANQTNQVGGTFAKTQFMAGNTRNRKMFSDVPVVMQYEFHWTPAQAAFFEAWYSEKTNEGAAWFFIKRSTPQGMAYLESKFSNPETPYTGPNEIGPGVWAVSMTLETRNRYLLPPGYLDYPGLIQNIRLFDLIMNSLRARWLVHSFTADHLEIAISDGFNRQYFVTDGGTYKNIESDVQAVYTDTGSGATLISPAEYSVSDSTILFNTPPARGSRILWSGTGVTYNE